jgi:hypothetical protein
VSKSKVEHLDSTIHVPRTVVQLTVNDPAKSDLVGDPATGQKVVTKVVTKSIVAPPSAEVLEIIAEMKRANPRNQPIRYETLQRWSEVLEQFFTPLPPL